MRFILRNLLTLLILFLFGSLVVLTTTEKGLNFAVWSFQHYMQPNLIIDKVEGRLSSHVIFKKVFFEDDSIKFTADDLELKWNPLGLLLNKFVIRDIVVHKPQIIIKKMAEGQSQPFNNWFIKHIAIKKFEIDELMAQKDKSIFEFTARYNQTWQGKWHLEMPDLKSFCSECSGNVYGDGTLSGHLLKPIVDIHLKATNLKYDKNNVQQLQGSGKLILAENVTSTFQMDAKNITASSGHIKKVTAKLNAKKNQEQLSTQSQISIDDQYSLFADILFPEFHSITDLSQSIRGKITGNTSHLAWLTDLYQEIKEPKGKLEAVISLQGSVNNPLFDGQLLLSNASCKIPSVGLNLTNINLQAKQTKQKQFTLKGQLQSGQGMTSVSGALDFTTHFLLNLFLDGNNVTLVKLRDYNVVASPKINLTYENSLLKIQGDLPILSAEITPKHFGSYSLPDEVIFVENKSTSTSLPLQTSVKLNLVLANKIHVVYKDLETYLKGKLTIHWDPKTNTTAIGELYTVNGTYSAYGQTLSILSGRLTYTGGSITNPGLNIRAGKQVKTVVLGGQSQFTQEWTKPVYTGTETVTVGLQILGSLDNRYITLFANPPGLKQNDILSYLTFGYPQSQISEQQNKILLKAASAINFGGGGKPKWAQIADQIQNKLGLSEMSVESTPVFNAEQGKIDSETSFVVGKKIFSNLYAHYSIGLTNPTSTLNLRYQISKRFAIQSETSKSGNGADLLYSIERD